MKIGDLVVPTHGSPWRVFQYGIITGWNGDMVVVHWGPDYPDEEEYMYQLEVISESR